MQLRSVLTGAALIGLALTNPGFADCTIPAHDSKSTTGDDYYYSGWRCQQAFIDFWWRGYDFNKDDWDQGFGFEAVCDLERPLARTFNGLYALHFAARDYPTNTGDFNGSILRWGGNYAYHEIDELDARCATGTNDTAYANTKSGLIIDNYTELSLKFFYELWPAERAGTIVHESRHAAGVGHNATKCGRGASCDSSFSYEGANRWQVLWLWWYYVDAGSYTWQNKERARARANLILSQAFETDPGFRIDFWGNASPI